MALPWHSIAEEIVDLNLKIITGHINKRMKSCHRAKPWGARDFFTGIGYPTHTYNLEGYVPSPESLVLPSKSPPTERTEEDQLFCLVHKRPDDPRERVDITSGSFSIPASQAFARKIAAAFSNALSIASMCTTGQRSLRNLR